MYTTNRGHIPECNQESVVSMDVAQPGEIQKVMSDLMGTIAGLQDAVSQLGSRLNPVLPERTTELANAPVCKQSQDYTCPLARAIENEIWLLRELDYDIRRLLSEIEI